MLKKLLFTLFVSLMAVSAMAQNPPTNVTIRQLNTYENGLFKIADIGQHPLVGDTVSFGAVIVSYPKNSGLASFNSTSGSIGRVHVFVVDTTAQTAGRDGMAIQIVESNIALIEGSNRGDVIKVTGRLTFFNNVAQFDLFTLEKLGDVNEEYARFSSLLAPVEVTNSNDLNTVTESGNYYVNLANYTKYQGQYIEMKDATIVNVVRNDTGRPNWAVKKGDALVYLYDVSLRYRNDRTQYREGYNRRRTEDAAFIPPNPGSRVNVSGFLALQGFSPNADIDTLIYQIAAWDDGVLWSENQATGELLRFVDGVEGFQWPVDLEVTVAAPFISDISLSDALPTSSADVVLTAAIEPGTIGGSIDSAAVVYSAGGSDVRARMTQVGEDWTYTFPRFADGTTVTYRIFAYETNGAEQLEGNSDSGSYLINDTPINSIYQIQYPGQAGRGDSPFAAIGDPFSVNIEATVVSGADDGIVVIHQADTAYSGVIVQANDVVADWVYGDVVTITRIEVREVFGVTSIIVLEGSVTGTKTEEETEALYPLFTTQELAVNEDAHEPWEGMVVEVMNVKVLTSQADGTSDFGEFEVGTIGADAASDTLEVGEGLRMNDDVNSAFRFFSWVPSTLNENVKVGATINWVQGVYYYSFGNAKMTPIFLDTEDLTYPERDITFFEPVREDGFFVAWTPSEDFDENDVTYEFALSTPDDELFEDPILRVSSDNEGVDTTMTFSEAEIEGLLAEQGLTVGSTAELIWTVFISDGYDVVQAASYSNQDLGSEDFPDGWTPFYDEVAATYLSVEGGDMPREFALNQNFPNPFNPTTRISYALPQASDVRLQIFDLLGRNVVTLVNTQMPAGRHIVDFDASRLASGIYIYRLQAGDKTFAKRMTLVK